MANDKKPQTPDKPQDTPATGTPEPQAQQTAPEPARPVLLEGNRIANLFESVLFEPADSRVYEQEGSTRKSKRVAVVACVFHGGMAAVPGSIYVSQDKPNAKKIAEFSFVGQRQVQAIKALDEGARVDLANFRHFVAAEYAKWRKAQPAAATTRTATGVEVGDDIDL